MPRHRTGRGKNAAPQDRAGQKCRATGQRGKNAAVFPEVDGVHVGTEAAPTQVALAETRNQH